MVFMPNCPSSHDGVNNFVHDDVDDDGEWWSPLINGVDTLHVPVGVARVSMGCHIVHPHNHLLYIRLCVNTHTFIIFVVSIFNVFYIYIYFQICLACQDAPQVMWVRE